MKEPYVGQIPLVSGEIAEDITQYFAASEQIPTVCALGVLVNPNLTIRRAGGFLIQLLPTADDAVIDAVERCVEQVPPVTKLLEDGLTPEEICRAVLPEFTLEVLDEERPVYRCNCSHERVLRALAATGRESVKELAQDPITEVCCQFCDKKISDQKRGVAIITEGERGVIARLSQGRLTNRRPPWRIKRKHEVEIAAYPIRNTRFGRQIFFGKTLRKVVDIRSDL